MLANSTSAFRALEADFLACVLAFLNIMMKSIDINIDIEIENRCIDNKIKLPYGVQMGLLTLSAVIWLCTDA